MKTLTESEKKYSRELVHKVLWAYKTVLCNEIKKFIEDGFYDKVTIHLDYGFKKIVHISRNDREVEIQIQQDCDCFTCYLEDLSAEELHTMWQNLINNNINEND